MIRIKARSYSRGRHVLLADVYDFAFLGRLRLAGRGRNVDTADDGKNNDKQTEFHVSSPKPTEAIQLPRAAQPTKPLRRGNAPRESSGGCPGGTASRQSAGHRLS